MWTNTGKKRPDNAIEPGPGQESVWDYPRPPALERDNRLVEVKDGDTVIASTTAAFRVLETASPPTFYIPTDGVDMDRLVEAAGRSGILTDSLAFMMDMALMDGAWRDAHIIPRYTAAGVRSTTVTPSCSTSSSDRPERSSSRCMTPMAGAMTSSRSTSIVWLNTIAPEPTLPTTADSGSRPPSR